MIYFLIGTKAQLIKTFPVMQGLERRGVAYRYLDMVQHGPLCEQLRARLGVREPDHFLAPRGTQVERTRDAVRWALAVLWRAWRGRRQYFPDRGVVVAHGDTLSTLLGWLIARLTGQRVCHLEAGERTYKLMRPFPEEIIRRIVDRYGDQLLACGDVQAGHLAREGYGARTVNLGANTLVDAVRHVADAARAGPEPDRPPIVVSVHRFETITSRERLAFLVEALRRLAAQNRGVFGIHPPTGRKLEEFGLLGRLQGVPNLELRGLFDYPEFIGAIARAKFLMTDGGGPQEESHFLGVPCLLLRDETERSHPNVFMPGWDLAKVDWFNTHCQEFRKAAPPLAHSPSARAIEAMVGPPA